MNVNYINPFLIASAKILKDMCFIDAVIGKPYMSTAAFAEDTTVINIGVTGEINGYVLIAMEKDACNIATRMVMNEINEMDSLALSALCELGNMILGNTATVFSTKGIAVDITPPSVIQGYVEAASVKQNSISIPLIYDEYRKIEITISLHGKNI